MARRTTIIASVFGVWLGLLTVVALHLLLGGKSGPQSSELRPIRQSETAVRDYYDGSTSESVISPSNPAPEAKRALETPERPGNIVATVEELMKNDGSDPRTAFEQVVVLSTLLPKIANISRIKTPSPEAFLNYIAPVGLPVIFTDMFDGSRLREWTWDYIREKWGDHVFHNTRQGNYSSRKTTAGKYYVNRVSIKLADFIDVVTGKRTPRENEKGLYITKQKVIPAEALETEFQYPPFYPSPHKNCYLEPTAWIGAPGTFTQGHIDSKDNFAYQIIGEKRWTIFSPLDYKYLYYIQRTGSLEWSTALNSLEKPDLKKYPLYAKTTPITFVLKAGEVLYLPRGWTHTVENVTPALMINTWRYGPAAITEYWSEKNRMEIRKRCF